jgi:hypothetical protein
VILLALALLAANPAPADHPKTYLLSIAGIPLRGDEGINKFSIATWGVTFDVVCHIPDGWTIKAGRGVTADGLLEGLGSNGVSWLRKESPSEFQSLVLVTLYGPVQDLDIVTAGGSGIIPATFKGNAFAWADDAERLVPITSKNIKLTPASRCPTAQ